MDKAKFPVRRVHEDQIEEIMWKGGSGYPRAMYLSECFDYSADMFGFYWKAMNNALGRAVCEDFASEYSALAWLGGRRAKNRYGELVYCDGTENRHVARDARHMTWEEYNSLNNNPAFRDIKNRN